MSVTAIRSAQSDLLIWFWPIEQPHTDRRFLRHEADMDLAGVCVDLGVMPTDAAHYFVCRNENDVAGLRLSMGVDPHRLASLAALIRDQYPVLAAVVTVRELETLGGCA